MLDIYISNISTYSYKVIKLESYIYINNIKFLKKDKDTNPSDKRNH